MRYQYIRDPLFLVCLLLYGVNRWLLKPYLPNPISIGYLNDLICIPFWIPIMLFIMRRIGLRKDDHAPQWYELLIPLIMWSWLFEAFLPRVSIFKRLATADYLDILCYTIGAIVAAVFWEMRYKQGNPNDRDPSTSSG